MVRSALGRFVATARRRERLTDLAFLLLLFGLIWLAYSPSQKHAPRADHWCFLVDTMKHAALADSVSSCYSYNRTRTVGPGDTDLFRPVLFALLATEQHLFAGDLWVYQTIGIFLHTGVCLLLFGLLQQLAAVAPRHAGEDCPEAAERPRAVGDYLPHALTAFFALNPAVQELVIWTHLHGYLLFLVFLLGSLILLLRHAAGPRAGSLKSLALWGAWGLALASAFTYELGQVYGVLAGAFLAAAGRGKVARSVCLFAFFASILVIYQGVNAHDLEVHRGRYVPDNNVPALYEQAFTPATLTHSAQYALYTVVQPFCPSLIQTSFGGGRLQVADAFWNPPTRREYGPLMLVSAATLALMAGLAAAGLAALSRCGRRPPLLAVLLLGSLFAAYAAITVLGRMNLRPGPAVLTSNSYYAYFSLLLGLATLFAACQGVGQFAGGWAARARAWLSAGLVVLALVGGEHVRRVNVEIAASMRGTTKPIRAVNRFVKEHRHEPDFSFAIDHESSDDIPKVHGVRITDAIFHRWLSDRPKYTIAVRDGRAVLLRGSGVGAERER
jgi:hypothetical protein